MMRRNGVWGSLCGEVLIMWVKGVDRIGMDGGRRGVCWVLWRWVGWGKRGSIYRGGYGRRKVKELILLVIGSGRGEKEKK